MTMQERISHITAFMEQAIDDGLPPYSEVEFDPVQEEMIFLWNEEKLAVIIELNDGRSPQEQVFGALGLPVMN
jgi:hypothetical protein